MAEERTRGRRGTGNSERRTNRRRGSGAAVKNASKGEDRPESQDAPEPVAAGSPDHEEAIDLNSLYKMDNQALTGAAKSLGITGLTSMRKQAVS